MSSRGAVLELVADAEALRPADYLAANPDVRAAGMDALEHYLNFGKAEGRKQLAIGSAIPQSPRELIVDLASRAPSVLEIGPFCSPAISGPNVSYFDISDRDQIIKRATGHNLDPSRTPYIHYVSPFGDLSIVDGKFDAVFSSHCIEHQPDLVSHLLTVSSLLTDGGAYFLLVPDKRYCFDHFIPESAIADVLDAFHQRRTRNTLSSLIKYRTLATHNDPVRHWNGDHGGDDLASNEADQINAAMREFEAAAGNYIDCHAWQFTPDNFRRIIAALKETGLIRYRCEVIDTMPGTFEFGAILRTY